MLLYIPYKIRESTNRQKEKKKLVQPQLFASVFLQLLPCGVGLFDDFLGGGNIEVLLVESERVERLVIRGLVPSEPFSDSVLDGIRDIIDVVVFLGKRIVDGDSDNLPVQFTIINHGQDTEGLDFLDGSHLEGGSSNFDNIDRIAGDLRDSYIGDPDMLAQLDEVISNVEKARQRVLACSTGPRTILGAGDESGESVDDPLVSGRRILVADDEPTIRDAIERLLAERGATVESFEDGSGAIELWELLDYLDLQRNRFAKRVFAIFDADGSNQIDFKEFVVALWQSVRGVRGTASRRWRRRDGGERVTETRAGTARWAGRSSSCSPSTCMIATRQEP